MIFGRSNWTSFVVSGAIAIVFSWLTSGCRLGSRQSAPPPNPDHYSGFYVTQPQTLTFYATTSSTQQKSAPVSWLPSETAALITNPVALIMQDLVSGLAVLYPKTKGKAYFPIFLNPDLTLGYSEITPKNTFWKDPDCKKYLEFTETGAITQNPEIASPTGNTLQLSGSLKLKIQMITRFFGNCEPTFQELGNCYQDANQCGGSSSNANLQIQADVVANFRPWIQSQVFSPADIPKLINYAYEVSYE